MSAGSAEHVRSLPLGVRIDGLAVKAGVLGATPFDEPAEVGEEAAGVAGGAVGEVAGAGRLGGGGVFARVDMTADCRGLWALRRGVLSGKYWA
jgi:hypothetical protein